MPIKYVISAWDGTLIEYKDEGKLMEKIGKDILFHSAPWSKKPSLIKTFFELKKMSKEYKEGKIGYDDIYEVFNNKVLKYAGHNFIRNSTREFARSPETQEKIDKRIVEPLYRAKLKSKFSDTGILSASYNEGIKAALEYAGYSNVFNHIISNKMVPDRRNGTRFDLKIYKNKDKFMEDIFFDRLKFNPQETMFIFDDIDDFGCASMVWYPVPSFFSSDEMKKKAEREFKTPILYGSDEFYKYILQA